MIGGAIPAPLSTKVIKLEDARVSIFGEIQISGYTFETRFIWQLDGSLICLNFILEVNYKGVMIHSQHNFLVILYNFLTSSSH